MELWHTTMSLILLLYKYNSTSSPRQEQKTILASIFHAITDPPVTKIRLWASLGCKSPLDGEPFKKTYLFFDDFEPNKSGKSSTSVLVPYCNRSGVVELVGREPLIFARVENSVTNFSPKRQKTPKFSKTILDQKQQFSVGNFHFFGRGKTTFFWASITSKLAS